MSHAATLAAHLQSMVDYFTAGNPAAIDVMDGSTKRTLPVTPECSNAVAYARKTLAEYHGRPIYDAEHAR